MALPLVLVSANEPPCWSDRRKCKCARVCVEQEAAQEGGGQDGAESFDTQKGNGRRLPVHCTSTHPRCIAVFFTLDPYLESCVLVYWGQSLVYVHRQGNSHSKIP